MGEESERELEKEREKEQENEYYREYMSLLIFDNGKREEAKARTGTG